uniref:coiled-coil domain-containing protein 106-like isoform X2 n=1 Tax=Monopterus albus TaxID=43700 RepID=UPI0009B3875B|nr:coiled-coil domain-containing protein 106-like isoform X2 [Monopterus albus]
MNEASITQKINTYCDQIAVAPTVTVAFAKAEFLEAKSEMNMYKLRVENLEEKVEALTKDRDFLRTQLSDVSEPSEVVHRYKTVLGIFQMGKTMAEAFSKFGVDCNTISQTSEIAKLAIAAPEKYAQLVQQVKGSKLSDIAKQCKEAVEADKATSETIKQMKENKELLPIRKH